jgi:hypothetical protein
MSKIVTALTIRIETKPKVKVTIIKTTKKPHQLILFNEVQE